MFNMVRYLLLGLALALPGESHATKRKFFHRTSPRPRTVSCSREMIFRNVVNQLANSIKFQELKKITETSGRRLVRAVIILIREGSQEITRFAYGPYVIGDIYLAAEKFFETEKSSNILGVWEGELEFENGTLKRGMMSPTQTNSLLSNDPHVLHLFLNDPNLPFPVSRHFRALSGRHHEGLNNHIDGALNELEARGRPLFIEQVQDDLHTLGNYLAVIRSSLSSRKWVVLRKLVEALYQKKQLRGITLWISKILEDGYPLSIDMERFNRIFEKGRQGASFTIEDLDFLDEALSELSAISSTSIRMPNHVDELFPLLFLGD